MTRPGEHATSEVLSTRVEWAHAPQTVCRLYRLNGTPQPAHSRGMAGLVLPGERVTVLALVGAGMSGASGAG